jgi:hypothetical protein
MGPILRPALLRLAVLVTANCAPAVDSWPSDGGRLDGSSATEASDSSLADSGPRSASDGAMDATAALDAADDTADDVVGDSTADALEAGSPCAGLFCEDFELGAIDSGRWTAQMAGGATVTIQAQTVAHGKYAAQFHSLGVPAGGATQAYVYLIATSIPTALRVHNFGRAYFYANPKPTSNNVGLVWGGTTGFPKPTYLSLASHSSGWQFGFIKLRGSPQGEVQSYPPDPVPVATWMCLEWEFDDQPDTINVWGDGKFIGTLDANHVDYPPGHAPGTPLYDNQSSGLIGAFTDFGFGFYDWHPGNFAFDVYYDDIVLGTKRVGCL